MERGVPDEKALDSFTWWLHKRGVRPNHFTLAQAPFLVWLWWAGVNAQLLLFGALQILVVLLDGIDGILARRTGTVTRRGHLLDSIFDIAGIGVTLWVVILLHPEHTQWAFALLFLNFVVYIQNEIQQTKSITYTRGPVTAGLYLAQWYPEVLLAGLLLPLLIGSILLVTRLELRKRLWNWYQFLTAGLRREYKAVPREQRAALTPPPARAPERSEEGATAHREEKSGVERAPPPP